METLPKDIINYLQNFTDIKSYRNLAQVNKRINAIIPKITINDINDIKYTLFKMTNLSLYNKSLHNVQILNFTEINKLKETIRISIDDNKLYIYLYHEQLKFLEDNNIKQNIHNINIFSSVIRIFIKNLNDVNIACYKMFENLKILDHSKLCDLYENIDNYQDKYDEASVNIIKNYKKYIDTEILRYYFS